MFVSLKSRLIGSFQIPCLLTILLLCAQRGFRTGTVKRRRLTRHGERLDWRGGGKRHCDCAQSGHELLAHRNQLTTKASIESSTCRPAITR